MEAILDTGPETEAFIPSVIKLANFWGLAGLGLGLFKPEYGSMKIELGPHSLELKGTLAVGLKSYIGGGCCSIPFILIDNYIMQAFLGDNVQEETTLQTIPSVPVEDEAIVDLVNGGGFVGEW